MKFDEIVGFVDVDAGDRHPNEEFLGLNTGDSGDLAVLELALDDSVVVDELIVECDVARV